MTEQHTADRAENREHRVDVHHHSDEERDTANEARRRYVDPAQAVWESNPNISPPIHWRP